MKRSALAKVISNAILIAVAAALYGQFLWNPIVFDDLYFFLADNAGEQPVSNYHFEWLQLRSLPYATLAWTKAWFGLDLIYFRVGNLILHAAVCCAMYGFLEALFSTVSMPAKASDSSTSSAKVVSPQAIALIAALIFAVHPIATYAAGYLVQRTIVFATLFSLLAMWSWTRGTALKRPLLLWLSVPLYYLAVFSKEHAIMLVVVLPLLTVLLVQDGLPRLKQQMPVIGALALIALGVVFATRGYLGSVYEIDAGAMLARSDVSMSYPRSVLTQATLFFKYVYLWLLPLPGWTSIDMREPFASMASPLHWAGALAFVVWGVAGGWLLLRRDSKSLLGFAMLFPWVMFMTELSSVRIQEIFVMYRSYLWAVGGFCALPYVVGRLTLRPTLVAAVLAASLLFLLSMERLMTMSQPVLLWEDAKEKLAAHDELPGASRIYYNLGTEYIKIDLPHKAIPELKHAIALNPEFSEAHGNLGAAYFKMSEWGLAAAAFSDAVSLATQHGKVPGSKILLGRAESYENAREADKAQADYREVCRLYKRSCDKVH